MMSEEPTQDNKEVAIWEKGEVRYACLLLKKTYSSSKSLLAG